MTESRRPQNRRAAPRKTESEPASISVPMHPETHEERPEKPVEKIGSVLKRARETRGDDIQQIADYLCIRRGFLEALEASRYDEFPADAYVIGFLRSYANYLGVDGKKAIDRYRSEMLGRRKKPALLVPTPIAEGQTPSAVIIVGALIAALLVYILWYTISSSDRTVVSAPPALPTATAETTPATTANEITTPSTTAGQISETSAVLPSVGTAAILPSAVQPSVTSTATSASRAAVPAPTQAVAVPGGGASRVSVRAEQSSWILISDGKGNTLYDEVMKPGDVYNVPDQPGLLMTTGNAGGVVLTLDGNALPKLASGSSHVMRNIALDPAHLKALASGSGY